MRLAIVPMSTLRKYGTWLPVFYLGDDNRYADVARQHQQVEEAKRRLADAITKLAAEQDRIRVMTKEGEVLIIAGGINS